MIKALGKENIDLIGFCEIDKFSSAVLAHHFPNTPNYGDITKLDIHELDPIDLLVG